MAGVAPQELLESLGVHSHPLIVLCTVVALLGALATGAAVIHRVAQGAVKLIWLRQRSFRRALRRRQLFASFVESRVRDLDNKEEWSDQRFAELEAEVETVGVARRRRLFGLIGSGDGLRRERSLSRALVRSREKLILLQGDPGSGKSVALRFVARRMAEQAMRSPRLDSVIPLYVNLKNLKPVARPIDAKLIEDYVRESVLAGSNRDVNRFLDVEFDRGREAGTWFFLFDSFDEIPAVLSATEATGVVREYSDAIFSFIHSLNDCRGIVASRHFRAPPRWGLPTFRIVPLSERRKRELIRKADIGPVEDSLLEELRTANPDVAGLSGNPLFLGLLTEYAHDNGQLPAGWHDVFETFVSTRLATDAGKVAEIFGIGEAELRLRAEQIAFTMTASHGLGLSPPREELRSAYLAAGFGAADRLSVAMDALEWIKLARPEESAAPDGSVFTFAHRRFQEYFATCVVLREPDRIPPQQLLTDASWRETTVTLCQAYADKAGEILAEADRILAKAAKDDNPDNGSAFVWPEGTLHLLSLLQSAFASRAEGLPRSLHEHIEAVFAKVERCGTITDRKWVLEVAGIGRPLNLAVRLRKALRDESAWLREVAYRQTARLGIVPADLVAEIRIALVLRTADLRLLRDWPATRAQLQRIRPSAGLMPVAQMLRAIPAIDILTASAVLVVIWLSRGLGPVAGITAALFGLLMVLSYFPVAARLAGGKLNLAGDIRAPRAWRRILGDLNGLLAMAGMQIRFFVALMAALLVSPRNDFQLLPSAMVFLLLTWVLAATFACVYSPPRTPLGWLFVHLRPLPRIVQTAQRLLRLLLRPQMLMVLVLLAALVVLSTYSEVGGLTLLILGMVPFALVAFIEIVLAISDALWFRSWKRDGIEPMHPELLLYSLEDLRKVSGAAQLVRTVRTQRLLPDTDEARLMLRDLLAAIDLGRNALSESGFQPRSHAFRSWWEDGDEQAMRAISRLRAEVVDEIGQLLEELERRQELPVA